MARVPRAAVDAGAPVRVPYPPFDVVVVKLASGYAALEDACNHAGASLSEGDVTPDGALRCPMHGYLFDLRTGALVAPKGLCDDQRRFEVTVEGEEIVIWDPVRIVIR